MVEGTVEVTGTVNVAGTVKVDNTAAAEVATLKAKNAQLEATVGSMLGTYINPQTFAPSQAVFAQMQAAKAATAAASNG